MEFPQRAADNARRLIEKIAVGMADADEAVYDTHPVEAIESEPRSGFWPWTSGGSMIVLPAALAHHWGTGNAPAPLQPLLDAGARLIEESWAEQYPDRPSLTACITAEPGTPAAEFQSAAERWEVEAWEADEDVYFWKARAMFLAPEDTSFDPDEAPDGGPYVYIDAYLNIDLNYGRDSIGWLRAYGSEPNQTAGDFKRVIPLAEFVTLDEDGLDAIAAAALAALP